MALPVTGPFIQEIGGTGDAMVYSYKKGYKQVRPYNLPLVYERRYAKVMSRFNSTRTARDASYDFIDSYSGNWNPLISRVYDKLKSRIGDKAEMAVNLAEANQSMTMMRNRLVQVTRFARHLTRGNLVAAASELKLSTVPKGASKRKSFANNWLEYYFGWAPLVSDIWTCVDILQSPYKDVRVRAMGRESVPYKYVLETPVNISQPNAWYPANLTQTSYRNLYTYRRVAMGTDLIVSNPNLWLANQLGLLNPASFLYERVPFSFVANWFMNVEQFLSLGTDFMGLTLSKTWASKSVRFSYDEYRHATYRWEESTPSGVVIHYGSDTTKFVANGGQIKRILGLIQPEFFVRPLKLWGWQRCLTAASLLTQQLVKR